MFNAGSAGCGLRGCDVGKLKMSKQQVQICVTVHVGQRKTVCAHAVGRKRGAGDKVASAVVQQKPTASQTLAVAEDKVQIAITVATAATWTRNPVN